MDTKNEAKPVQADIVEKNLDGLPVMEINVPAAIKPEGQKEIVSHEQMTELYSEILTLMRDERGQINEMIDNFANMVFNEGDASSASKEALVSLVKNKTDVTKNMTHVMDLLMRALLKDRDTFKPYLNATQHNEIKVTGSAKRQLLEKLAKRAKKEG